jgi:uncharacterized membrane protein
MDFLFTARFLKIAFTSAIVFVLLDFLWLAAIASAWNSQALGYLAELDHQGKIVFNILFGFCWLVPMNFILIAALPDFLLIRI